MIKRSNMIYYLQELRSNTHKFIYKIDLENNLCKTIYVDEPGLYKPGFYDFTPFDEAVIEYCTWLRAMKKLHKMTDVKFKILTEGEIFIIML